MRASVLIMVLLAAFAGTASAQGTSFNYQGRITESGAPGNGSFQMQFKLFDALTSGTQIGSTITNSDVTVADGVFSIRLDFGSSPFSGADRYLEIAVRRNAGQSFTILSPRQQITSSPYSIRTLSAAQADMAADSQKLGGVNASEYVTNSTESFIRNRDPLAGFPPQTGGFGVTGNAWIQGSLGLGGTLSSSTKLTITGQDAIQITGFQPFITFRDQNSNKSARIQSADGKLIFRPDTPPSAVPGLVMGADGFVGIGTSSPAARLNVVDSSSVAFRATTTLGFAAILDGRVAINGPTEGGQAALAISNGPVWTSAGWRASAALNNGSAFAWLPNSGSQRFGIGQSNGGLYFFRTSSQFGSTALSPSYDLVITDAGRVGINTTTPDATLSVNGTASKTNGGSWANFSDERLKNIKGRFTSGLESVMQLEPVRYELRTDNELGLKADGEQIGFSAQAVERVLPEAVIKNDKGYLLVNNDPILWTMLNAIKEQHAQLEAQQRQIRVLSDLICDLKRDSEFCREKKN